jgi:hypothetical protein
VLGIEAEAKILREYFNSHHPHRSGFAQRDDPAAVSEPRRGLVPPPDHNRHRRAARHNASSVDVVASDGTVYTPADYLALLDFAAEHP